MNETGDRDPAEVTQYQMLAMKMPSVLSQLKPMAKTSVDMLRYLDTDRSPATRRVPGRRPRRRSIRGTPK